jgi:hypothetical protein
VSVLNAGNRGLVGQHCAEVHLGLGLGCRIGLFRSTNNAAARIQDLHLKRDGDVNVRDADPPLPAVAVLVGSDQDWAALKAAMDVGKTGVVGLKGPQQLGRILK